MSKKIFGLVLWLCVSFIASAVGAVASVDAGSFYSGLTQPSWAPPAAVFGPVWTVLYILMALAAWLVWLRGGFAANRQALTLFLVQLAINAVWSWLFFAWRLGLVALLDVSVLWLLVLATLVAFWRILPLAGLLLVPYLLWISFAWVLNFSLWQLNPAALA